MKKILFLSLAAVIMLGAGCSLWGGGDDEVVTGDWWITTENPQGWVTYAHYTNKDANPGEVEITRELTDVAIQSTDLPIILEGDQPGSEVTQYVDSDYSYIRVIRYDVNYTVIPEEAEELNNGFFKRVKDNGDVDYWLPGVYGNYRFMVYQEGQDLSAAEEVIFTAKEVTEIE